MFRSLPTRIRNSLKGANSNKIFFLHIPKCGGTSIIDAVRKSYITLNPKADAAFIKINNRAERNVRQLLEEEKSPEFSVSSDCKLRFSEQLLLYYMSLSQVKILVGHIPFSKIAFRNFSDDYAFVTILRDPVERWISEFYYNKLHSNPAFNPEAFKMDINEYAMSSYGKAQGTEYVLYLGGRSNGNDHYSKKAVQRAIENLKRFAIVGLLEDLGDFAERFNQRFGVRLNIRQKNLAPQSQSRKAVTDEMRRQIENICERDYEIYHSARKLVLNR